MKNHVLGITGSLIPYYKELNTYTGSVTATILMTQLEYWFSKMGGKQFFKFLEPCQRRDYIVGDSWVEELGFSKYEFRTAFSKIGKTYKSKKQYLNSQDLFEGKLYLSYYERLDRRTYYVRNHEKVDQLLEQWISRKSTKPISRDGQGQFAEIENVAIQKPQKSISRKEESRLPITGDYSSRIEQEIKAVDYSQDKEAGVEKDVVDLFNLTCPSLPKVQVMSDQRKKAISRLLKHACDKGDFIEILFQKVEESDFLCGRSGKWKASFDWVIKQGNVIKIMEGNYGNHSASAQPKPDSLTDQLKSQTVQDFINH